MGYDKPEHAKKNPCFGFSYGIVAHPLFNLIIVLLIVSNIVVLSIDQNNHIANVLFTICFTTEMIIKLFGLGMKEYGRDFYNWFDAILVIASLVEIILHDINSSGGTSSFTALRGVRLLRIFKLAR